LCFLFSFSFSFTSFSFTESNSYSVLQTSLSSCSSEIENHARNCAHSSWPVRQSNRREGVFEGRLFAHFVVCSSGR
jgi:hypothetical protein